MHIKGYKHVLQEISIVNILKQLRVLQAAAKQGRSEHEWQLLNDDNAMKAYSDLDSDKIEAIPDKIGDVENKSSESYSFISVDLS